MYLLADSQLLFWKDEGGRLFLERVREQIESEAPAAAYIGASNRDLPEYYSLFHGAMEQARISNCRMIPSRLQLEDREFVESADLLLLAGGDVELGWNVFHDNGLKEIIARKRLEGAVLIGISAGAVQMGMGWLTESANMKKMDMFRFAPFYVGAHEEQQEWWNLRALVNLAGEEARGIGIPTGGGAIYSNDGTLEPVRKPLVEFLKQEKEVSERLLMPL
jgi:cyanophycinase-like exopeptidase